MLCSKRLYRPNPASTACTPTSQRRLIEAADVPPPDIRPLTMIRRVVARKMTQAAQTIPAVTLHRHRSTKEQKNDSRWQ